MENERGFPTERVRSEEPALGSQRRTQSLTQETLIDLLAPSVWRAALEQYARATQIAVQFFDHDGNVITDCINAQPLWRAMQRNRTDGRGCGFSIAGETCTCVKAAFDERKNVFVTGETGLVHFAVPLFLQETAVGVLLAGQVFDQYPEMLSLDRAARASGRSTQQLWNLESHSRPMPRATLHAYSELLTTLATSILQ